MAILKFKNENNEWEIVESPDTIKYIEQQLSEEQKRQARKNIGALSNVDLSNYVQKETSKGLSKIEDLSINVYEDVLNNGGGDLTSITISSSTGDIADDKYLDIYDVQQTKTFVENMIKNKSNANVLPSGTSLGQMFEPGVYTINVASCNNNDLPNELISNKEDLYGYIQISEPLDNSGLLQGLQTLYVYELDVYNYGTENVDKVKIFQRYIEQPPVESNTPISTSGWTKLIDSEGMSGEINSSFPSKITSQTEDPMVESVTLGEEIIKQYSNDNINYWTVPENWTIGSNDVGNPTFTHTKTTNTVIDYDDSLEFDISQIQDYDCDGYYVVSFEMNTDITASTYLDDYVLVELGGTQGVTLYGFKCSPIMIGIRPTNNNPLKFTVSTSYNVTIGNISVKKIKFDSVPFYKLLDTNGITSFEMRAPDGALKNTYIGVDSGKKSLIGYENVGLGNKALSENSTGFWNTAVGSRALANNQSGARNIAIGRIALENNVSGKRNIAIGTFSLSKNISGNANIAIGADSVQYNETGSHNIGIGQATLAQNQTGNNNIAMGRQALAKMKNKDENIAIGYAAMGESTSGAGNFAMGKSALNRCNGYQNIAIGSGAGAATVDNTIYRNILIGNNTGLKLQGSSNSNTIIGFNAGNAIKTGNNNIVIGSGVQIADGNNQLNIGNIIKGSTASGSEYIDIDADLSVKGQPIFDEDGKILDSRLPKIDIGTETIVTSITNNHLVLEHNQDARLGTLSILTVSLPSEIVDNYKSYLCFTSSETPMSFACNSDIIWMGDDVNEDGVFTPDTDTMYEVSIRKVNEAADGTPIIVARTGMTTSQYTEKDNTGITPPAYGGGEFIYYTHIFQNLLNPDEIESGYINPANGALLSHSTYKATGYIPVKPGDEVGMCIELTSGQNVPISINYLGCYDKDKNAIPNALTGTQYWFTVPENVYYIRATYQNPNNRSVSFEVLNGFGNCPKHLNYGETLEYKVPKCETDIRFFLPKFIYGYVGETFDIYLPAIFGSIHSGYTVELDYQPTSATALFNVGDRKITVEAKGVGALPMAMNVINSKGKRIASKRFVVSIKAKSTATKTIVPIGDSLTNNKYWKAEIMRLNNGFTFMGSKSGSLPDSEDISRTYKHCGYAGWGAAEFYTKASSSTSGASEINPFWDSTLNDGAGGFSWNYFVQNTLDGVSPDIVNFFLGMNDITKDIDLCVSRIKLMVDDILNTSSNIKIVLCAPQYRDYKYSAGTISGSYNLMVKLYDTFKNYSSIKFVPLGLYHDSEYNYMDGSKMTVNPRSELQIDAVTDVTHPQKPGYWQIADAIFSALCAI